MLVPACISTYQALQLLPCGVTRGWNIRCGFDHGKFISPLVKATGSSANVTPKQRADPRSNRERHSMTAKTHWLRASRGQRFLAAQVAVLLCCATMPTTRLQSFPTISIAFGPMLLSYEIDFRCSAGDVQESKRARQDGERQQIRQAA